MNIVKHYGKMHRMDVQERWRLEQVAEQGGWLYDSEGKIVMLARRMLYILEAERNFYEDQASERRGDTVTYVCD